jgi:hypothetical protein
MKSENQTPRKRHSQKYTLKQKQKQKAQARGKSERVNDLGKEDQQERVDDLHRYTKATRELMHGRKESLRREERKRARSQETGSLKMPETLVRAGNNRTSLLFS